jgi:type II secretory ATPase GspE/PulE/Tfp pilus assembly ATPase PilB-like protein
MTMLASPTVRRRPDMKALFFEAAKAAGLENEELGQKLIENAARQGRSIIDDMIDSKQVNEEDFLRQVAVILALPYESDLKPRHSRKLREVCNAQVALRHRVLPLALGHLDLPAEPTEDEAERPASALPDVETPADGDESGEADAAPDRIVLVTYDPFNLLAKQAASQAIDLPIEWRMASRTRVLQGIQKLYGVGADTFEQILAGREGDTSFMDMKEEVNVLDEDDEEASVVKFVNTILRQALNQRATDIHVEPLEANLRVRYRIDGRLQEVPVPENIKALQSMVIARLKIMSRLDIAERRLPQDGRIGLELEGKSIDVRVATIPTVEGEQVSLRLLNQEKFSIQKLGLEPHVRTTIESLLKMSNGIILITGPTGSGKSTSLYAFLSELNTPFRRIVTVEDPVENKLEGVMQIAVKPEINLTFAAGLRSILRADPNVVMVGEMRDLETAEIAIRAALTGHLVFSTLHTNDAIAGITRLVDMGVEPFLVSASVRAFLAQRLVRRLCKKCRKPVSHDREYLDSIGFPSAKVAAGSQIYMINERGCDNCSHTGVLGRLAIYEIAVLTQGVQDLVVKRATESDIRAKAIEEGFIPMRQYGFKKVLDGETSIEEVISVTTMDMKMIED